jgi:hypothetical protein
LRVAELIGRTWGQRDAAPRTGADEAVAAACQTHAVTTAVKLREHLRLRREKVDALKRCLDFHGWDCAEVNPAIVAARDGRAATRRERDENLATLIETCRLLVQPRKALRIPG